MKTIKIKNSTPDGIRKAVLRNLNRKDAVDFDTMVIQSVYLDAKNSYNFRAKDLAVLQICDLAAMYGLKVELI